MTTLLFYLSWVISNPWTVWAAKLFINTILGYLIRWAITQFLKWCKNRKSK